MFNSIFFIFTTNYSPLRTSSRSEKERGAPFIIRGNLNFPIAITVLGCFLMEIRSLSIILSDYTFLSLSARKLTLSKKSNKTRRNKRE